MAASSSSSALVYTPVEEIKSIVASQRAYFSTQITKTYEWRKSQIEAIIKLVKENEKALADGLRKDFNKPYFEAIATEHTIIVVDAEITIKELKNLMAPKHVPTPLAVLPGSAYIHYEPYGVTLIIAPFNYPLQLMFQPLIAAIAAGNCAVIKPSELTPATSALVGQLIPKYLDRRAFSVVQGAVAETQALLKEKFDYIFFTGSEMVGKIVMQEAAKTLTPVTLELGGKSPVIVNSDADLTIAARRVIWGRCLNGGQTCIAPDYVYVHSAVKKQFIEKVKENLETFYGKDPSASPDFARIISERHTQRLAAIIDSHKADIIHGGQVDISNKYIAPTLLDLKTTPQGKAMADEIFGPILPILEFTDVNQAIEYINSKAKPLALYIFTNSSDFADKIIDKTSSGGVSVNDTLLHCTLPDLPFGGVGSSGLGQYHGRFGFEAFSHAKAVLKKSIYGDAPMRYPPYTSSNLQVFKFAASIHAINSSSFRWVKYLVLAAGVIYALKAIGVSITFNSNL